MDPDDIELDRQFSDQKSSLLMHMATMESVSL
jgi:hypothetical protein